jgi:hypothetical protein
MFDKPSKFIDIDTIQDMIDSEMKNSYPVLDSKINTFQSKQVIEEIKLPIQPNLNNTYKSYTSIQTTKTSKKYLEDRFVGKDIYWIGEL